MVTWNCIKHCGACCYLKPSERPDLDKYLSNQELQEYLSLVGDDGWCIHFDHQQRQCLIYPIRPRFCRVQPDVFADLYGVDEEDFADFAISCCLEQIESIYGRNSSVMSRYLNSVVFKSYDEFYFT